MVTIGHRSRLLRFRTLASLYALVSLAAFVAAYLARFNGYISDLYLAHLRHVVSYAVLVQTCVLAATGQASVLPTYFCLVDLRVLLFSNALSSILRFAAAAFFGAGIPRGVMILDLILLTGGATARAALRYWRKRQRSKWVADPAVKGIARPTAVVGAGDSGAAIARELLNKPSLRLEPVGFLFNIKHAPGSYLIKIVFNL
jgi:FlaA1/EpsC-like NDP-sugar epimerase